MGNALYKFVTSSYGVTGKFTLVKGIYVYYRRTKSYEIREILKLDEARNLRILTNRYNEIFVQFWNVVRMCIKHAVRILIILICIYCLNKIK